MKVNPLRLNLYSAKHSQEGTVGGRRVMTIIAL